MILFVRENSHFFLLNEKIFSPKKVDKFSHKYVHERSLQIQETRLGGLREKYSANQKNTNLKKYFVFLDQKITNNARGLGIGNVIRF